MIQSTPSSTAADVCAETTVAQDLTCRGCDYNLRTLRWNDLCPECAQPVAQSQLPQGFDFTSWRNIVWLRRGLRLIVVGILGATLLTIGITVVFCYFNQLLQQGHVTIVRACVRMWAYGGLTFRTSLLFGIV